MKKRIFLCLALVLSLFVGCGAGHNSASPKPNEAKLENSVLPEHITDSANADNNSNAADETTGRSDINAGYVWKLAAFSCSSHIDNVKTLHKDEADGFYVLGADSTEEQKITVYHCDGNGTILSETQLPVLGNQKTSIGDSGIVCGNNTIWFDYSEIITAGGGDQRGNSIVYIAACDYNGNLLFASPLKELIQADGDSAALTGMVLSDNCCVFSTEHQVAAVDSSGSIVWKADTDLDLSEICLGSDNQLYFLTYSDVNHLFMMEPGTHKITPLKLSLSDGFFSLQSGILNYDLLLENHQGSSPQVYGLHVDTGEKTLLYDLGVLGIYSIGNIIETSGELIVFDYFNPMGTRSLGKMVQAPMSNETISLSLGVCGTLSSTAESAVAMFNSQHTDAYLSVQQYDSSDALDLAIVSGEGPDIICFDGLSEEDYARNGYLYDLYTCLNQDQTSKLLERYRQEYEIDGKLYRISPVFCIEALNGNSAFLHQNTDSFKEMLSVAQSVPDSCMILPSEPAHCLNMMLQRSMTQFVDFKSHSCDFENDEFEALLSLCALSTQITESYLDQYDNWLFDFSTYSLPNIEYYNDMPNTSILGFPKTKILATQPGDTFGIYAKSAHPEIASSFIDLLLTEDIQRTYSYSTGYYPVLQPIFEELVPAEWKDAVATSSGHHIAISPVYEIIDDEAAAFFSGDQTASQTAQHIQSRVSIYLGEQN